MTIRVGVIGTGNIGTAHAVSLAKEVSGSALTAVFDVDAARAQQVAEGLGARAVPSAEAVIDADDVDALVIASPDALHAEHALACMAAGKPAMLEKPLAPTLEEARTVLDAEITVGKRMLMLGFMRRFDPGYLALKRALMAGEIGEALILHNKHRNAFAPYGVDSAMNLTNSAVHEIDINRWLLGDDYTWVQIAAGKPGPDVPEGQFDPMFLTLGTMTGPLVTVELFMTSHYGYEVNCEIVGSEGVLDMGDGSWVTKASTGHRGHAVPEQWLGRFGEAYRAELQAWIDGIRGDGAASGASTWDGYMAALTCRAAIDALASDGAVRIEIPNRPALYS